MPIYEVLDDLIPKRKDGRVTDVLSTLNPVGTGSFSMNRLEGSAVGNYSTAVGYNCKATEQCSFAEGNKTTASAFYAHAEGESTEALGYASHSEGSSTHAEGYYTHAEGWNTYASGDGAHAEGYGSRARGLASHAEGDSNVATGAYSHAEGEGTYARGAHSHTEGHSTDTDTDSDCAHAEGYGTGAYGYSSHSEGYGTQANGHYSHAEGNNSIAQGEGSHVEGYNTFAEGKFSHAQGYGTIARADSSHVTGKYNIDDTQKLYAEIVGNGSYDKPSNARTLDWEGNEMIAGYLKAAGLTNGTTSKTMDDILLSGGTSLNQVYPVGSIYMSTNSTSPASLFGGTWERINGRFLLGAGANAANTNTDYGSLSASAINRTTIGEMGGEVNHTLTTAQMPSHTHSYRGMGGSGKDSVSNTYGVNASSFTSGKGIFVLNYADSTGTRETSPQLIGSKGSGSAHNNMPPYFVVYMWKRTG